jgi:quercetin dioxygenase-like cupin family protein
MAVVQPDDSAPKVDPGDAHGRVETLGIVMQEVTPGGRIGPHVHDVDEAITVLAGEAEVHLGDGVHRLGAGGVAFMPAGLPHATHNRGSATLRIHAVFAATSIEIASLDTDPPGRGRYDLRTDEYVVLD